MKPYKTLWIRNEAHAALKQRSRELGITMQDAIDQAVDQ